VICRFAGQHQRWPLKKEMEAFAERESLVVRPPHGSHADYLAEAKRLLRRDDAAAFAAAQRAGQAAAAAKRERARKQRAEASTRYRARRRARATPL
jgi:antirestriction protein ArdC